MSRLYTFAYGLAVFLILAACEEGFIHEPPFEQVSDTIYLDAESWYFFDKNPVVNNDISFYPFSYQILESTGEGYLLKSEKRIYFVESLQGLDNREVLLDIEVQVGDTIQKFSNSRYYILIDKQNDPFINDQVFFVLRRSKKGVRRVEERSVWVLSPKKGILSVANYDIDLRNGQVTLDMVGNPAYFREKSFITLLKLYDFDTAYQVDRDRNIIYEFDKHTAVLKSKDFLARKDLFSYQFEKKNMNALTDFRIELGSNTVRLVAGDSCFLFSDALELLRSSSCAGDF